VTLALFINVLIIIIIIIIITANNPECRAAAVDPVSQLLA